MKKEELIKREAYLVKYIVNNCRTEKIIHAFNRKDAIGTIKWLIDCYVLDCIRLSNPHLLK